MGKCDSNLNNQEAPSCQMMAHHRSLSIFKNLASLMLFNHGTYSFLQPPDEWVVPASDTSSTPDNWQ
eukprot:jgi/Psemu1/43777/gm1.43777_g